MTPEIRYPAELPVSAHRAEILDAVRHNPVVVVCGDTGSGKTTQLPKMMLELGRGARGRRIAVTQPRRLAAVTMAERVADELRITGSEPEDKKQEPTDLVGGLVGYRHRYAKAISSETRIEFLTDGVLLAETKFDPLLRMYDTIVIDEAHERSLNVDFLLGILKRILERRHDLKVVIASATMDTAKFAEFFNAPIINVPGRLFPIDIRYRASEDDGETDLAEAVAGAIRELPDEGDVLVFLSGERDIRDCGEHLDTVFGGRYEIIPLIASLPAAEQRRAFRLSSRRRIVLATNVAETSVTIPGIRAVIDSGLARISRYVHRTQVQRLQIEPISQASARQRAGRCGRLGPGTCIRLYSEEDFLKRDAYTAPEVLRSSLAGVILTMLDLRLGNIESFPFIDPPKPAMVREGLKELLELGAITRWRNMADATPASRIGKDISATFRRDEGVASTIVLTDIGKKLARIPLEPRLARMLIAASDNAVLPFVLPIVASMACDDPRRRPIDEKEKASQAHAKWRVPNSDFLCTRRLWDWWKDETRELSQAKARKLAKANYLAWPKLREWTDLTRQLETLCKRMGLSFAEIPVGAAGSPPLQDTYYAAVHMSLLAGLLGRIGHYHAEDREYRGAHAVRFALHPGSTLGKTRDRRRGQKTTGQEKREAGNPDWIVAGELVDTARLFAREAAIIDPDWLEPIARDICKHHVHSPFWDAASGFVRATEQVTLYGLVIVEARRCDYSRFNPEGAREIFLRQGLIGGEFPHPPPVLRETLTFLRALRDRAEKTREAEIFDEMKLLAHFTAAVPAEITNANALRKWLVQASNEELERFRLRRKDWWPDEAASQRDFPDVIVVKDVKLKLSYRNTPDDPDRDGLTCTVRRGDAAALQFWRSDWLVPGLLRKKVSYLLLCLPNSIQRLLRPLDESLTILMDLLRAAASPAATGQFPLEREIRRCIRDRWGFRIPEDVWSKAKIPAYLQVRFVIRDDKDGRVLLDTRDRSTALEFVAAETKRIAPPLPEKTLGERLAEKIPFSCRGKLPLGLSLYLGELGWKEADFQKDIREGAIRASLNEAKTDIRSSEELIRSETEIFRLVRESVDAMRALEAKMGSGEYPETTTDSVLGQLAWLTFKGFPKSVPIETLRRYSRYFKAIDVRLQRAKVSPSSDRAKEARFTPYWERYREALKDREHCDGAALIRYRWLLEEYRIQLFAPELKTHEPVSPQRLDAIRFEREEF